MNTCFIFFKPTQSNESSAIVLDNKAYVIQPLKTYSVTEIYRLQQTCRKTIVVMPCEFVRLFLINLPKLAPKKAQTTLLYALEEKLAESIEHIHLTFDYLPEKAGYIVAACSLTYFQDFVEKLNHLYTYDEITLNWCALQTQEIALLNKHALFYDPPQALGSLSLELMPHYIDSLPKDHEVKFIQFTDSTYQAPPHLVHKQNEPSKLWLAQRLLSEPRLNLAHGLFQISRQTQNLRKSVYAAILLSVLWVCMLGLNHIFYWYQLKHTHQHLTQEITKRYQQLFPQDKRMIHPRYRVMQLLKTQHQISDDPFWLLLNSLSSVLPNNIQVVELRYANQTIIFSFNVKNFKKLEQIEASLKKRSLQVNQIQAVLGKNSVLAQLELKL